MTALAFTDEDGNPLRPPQGKHLEILREVLRPDPKVKPIDVCCGLGFAKTFLAIQAAALTLNYKENVSGLFLQPDWDRVNTIFLPCWEAIVPQELYKISIGKGLITWYNGSKLYFRPRVITGAREMARSKFRGIPFIDFVIDDETAIAFDYEQYQNTFARIRGRGSIRYYLTLSTPLVGPYGRFLKRGGNTLFIGRTDENVYLLERDPDYVKRLEAFMSPAQARRELYGELVALEGRIWKTAKWSKYDKEKPDVDSWPNGNRNDLFPKFNPREPWWLFCDLGSATGAYAVVQSMDAIHHGQRIFDIDPVVWVAIADYCPNDDASASRAFQLLRSHFGIPAAVVAGSDINTRDRTEGRNVSKFVTQIFGPSVHIYPVSEHRKDKQIQGDCFDYLLCSAIGERRFTIARDFVSLAPDTHRGICEMLLEDQYPPIEKQIFSDYYPKGKDNVVQHIRDALLMGSYAIMHPPRWTQGNEAA